MKKSKPIIFVKKISMYECSYQVIVRINCSPLRRNNLIQSSVDNGGRVDRPSVLGFTLFFRFRQWRDTDIAGVIFPIPLMN
jgi:hypothetical protein